ncbi:MAG: LysR family transcriptional regulator [Clostridia bacterium]|nr:LysR family transcriptional regulator [Clostridia bacterium]
MFDKKEYIYTVFKEKSFTAAAEKLYVSQPCLSAAIKKTEQQIGLPLFERRTGDLTPTKIGYEYLACAEKIMEIERSFCQLLEDMSNMKVGSIRIGGTNYICSHVLPILVNHFLELYPNIDISIYEANSVELEKMLLSGRLDLLIDSYDAKDDRLEYTELVAEKILLAVPSACTCNEALSHASITTADIYHHTVSSDQLPEITLAPFQNEKFILLKQGNSMYKHAMSAFTACSFTPNINFRLDQLSTSFSLTASGNGLCFVPDTMFKMHLYNDNVLFYNVKGAGSRILYIANHPSNHTTAIQMFKETAKSMMEDISAPNEKM